MVCFRQMNESFKRAKPPEVITDSKDTRKTRRALISLFNKPPEDINLHGIKLFLLLTNANFYLYQLCLLNPQDYHSSCSSIHLSQYQPRLTDILLLLMLLESMNPTLRHAHLLRICALLIQTYSQKSWSTSRTRGTGTHRESSIKYPRNLRKAQIISGWSHACPPLQIQKSSRK